MLRSVWTSFLVRFDGLVKWNENRIKRAAGNFIFFSFFSVWLGRRSLNSDFGMKLDFKLYTENIGEQ
jgi:hypothetical protein